MARKTIFLVHHRIFADQDDEEGNLSIDSIHDTLKSANKRAEACLKEEDGFEDAEFQDKSVNDSKFGRRYGGQIWTCDDPFSVSCAVKVMQLQRESSTAVEASDVGVAGKTGSKRLFSGMNFSFLGELDPALCDEVRFLVVLHGGKWLPLEYAMRQDRMPDYVVVGNNVPAEQTTSIMSLKLPAINHPGLLRMVRSFASKQETTFSDERKCLSGLNFRVIGENDGSTIKQRLINMGGTVIESDWISQMDYIIRRGGNTPAALEIFTRECQSLIKIPNPTIITFKELMSQKILPLCPRRYEAAHRPKPESPKKRRLSPSAEAGPNRKAVKLGP